MSLCTGDTAAAQWKFTLSGITHSSGCATGVCNAYNRTWTLDYEGGCVWSETFNTGLGFGFCTDPIVATLTLFIGKMEVNLWTDRASSVDIVEWRKTIADPYDCMTSHDLTFVTGIGCNWPATITISPV